MSKWFEPNNFYEWISRIFSLRPILISLFVITLFISELRFDWIERSVGSYLVFSNQMRPKSGTIWETSRQTKTARLFLEQIIIDRQSIQREAGKSSTFQEIIRIVSNDRKAVLSPKHFQRLYLNLPPTMAKDMISPFELIRLNNTGMWERTFLEKSGRDLVIYFLDAQNRALKELNISAHLLSRIEGGRKVKQGLLDDVEQFDNRIFQADHFFNLLIDLPEEIRLNIVPQPERLLNRPGVITRVGISNEAVSGYIEIGFEVNTGDDAHIVIMNGNEWAVWRMYMLLTGQREGKDKSLSRRFDEDDR